MMKTSDKPDSVPGRKSPLASATARKRVDSRELFGAVREVVIDHVGEEYRLRITNQGKLILTK